MKHDKVATKLEMYQAFRDNLVIGEATAYMWHEYLTWVPPDAPAKSV